MGCQPVRRRLRCRPITKSFISVNSGLIVRNGGIFLIAIKFTPSLVCPPSSWAHSRQQLRNNNPVQKQRHFRDKLRWKMIWPKIRLIQNERNLRYLTRNIHHCPCLTEALANYSVSIIWVFQKWNHTPPLRRYFENEGKPVFMTIYSQLWSFHLKATD